MARAIILQQSFEGQRRAEVFNAASPGASMTLRVSTPFFRPKRALGLEFPVVMLLAFGAFVVPPLRAF